MLTLIHNKSSRSDSCFCLSVLFTRSSSETEPHFSQLQPNRPDSKEDIVFTAELLITFRSGSCFYKPEVSGRRRNDLYTELYVRSPPEAGVELMHAIKITNRFSKRSDSALFFPFPKPWSRCVSAQTMS